MSSIEHFLEVANTLPDLNDFLESLFICVMDGSVKRIKMGNKLYEIYVDILETDE